MIHADFQRARRPEQVEIRKGVILAMAREMLRQRPLAELSLNELASRVGLAKSNVLRYFESREAIFLEILDELWQEWLDALDAALAAGTESVKTESAGTESAGSETAGTEAGGSEAAATGGTAAQATAGAGPYAREEAVARAVADTLIARPMLCELLSAMAGVLERKISVDFARRFKERAMGNVRRLGELVGRHLPALEGAVAEHFAGAVIIVLSGLWPYAHPTEAVARVAAELGLPPAEEAFPTNLRDGLTTYITGLTVRAAERGGMRAY
ncbi:TetR family transcriptional regulator [Sphaerisporangium sp. NPDC051011]|uniref:TetR/AcrR family transcriptional regulator n=1 Tax=Sphaerisporangium sp. NPDC051011 TaxID=3155792 RepID=UPI0034033455